MGEFDRATPWCGNSLAMVAFRRQFTEINEQYWGAVPSELLVRRLVSQHPLETPLTVALSATTGEWHRVGHDLGDLQSRFDTSRRWARLLSLVLLSSALELYLRNVTRAAQLSDPARKGEFPQALDGLTLLRHGVELQIYPAEFTKGDWSKRVASYRRHFSTVPAVLQESIGDLDKMQKLRNRVAHEFGLDKSSHPYGYLRDGAADQVTESRLQDWLGIVDAVASAIDDHLTTTHIGDFETLELLHHWQQDRSDLMSSTGVTLSKHALSGARPFMKYLAAATRRTTSGKQYWEGLRDYYKRA